MPIDIFSLTEPEEPVTAQVELISKIPGETGLSSDDLSPIGWSYLGKATESSSWYYQALVSIKQKNWFGQTVKPRTAIYLRSEPVSAVNPDPVAIAVIGNDCDFDECLRIVGQR